MIRLRGRMRIKRYLLVVLVVVLLVLTFTVYDYFYVDKRLALAPKSLYMARLAVGDMESARVRVSVECGPPVDVYIVTVEDMVGVDEAADLGGIELIYKREGVVDIDRNVGLSPGEYYLVVVNNATTQYSNVELGYTVGWYAHLLWQHYVILTCAAGMVAVLFVRAAHVISGRKYDNFEE